MAVNELSKGEYDLDEHIKLGKYKGVQVNVKSEKKEVTDDDINVEIQMVMRSSEEELKEVKDREVQIGDTVNIDFEGFKDDEPFEGGKGEDYELLIGSGAFIPGFEEKLIGAKKGDQLDLDLTFPEDYHSEDLAGKDVVFKVKVNSISIYELSEEYVKNNTEEKTIEDYKAAIAKDLKEKVEANLKDAKNMKAYLEVLDNSEIISIPQTLFDYHKEDLRVYYVNYAQMYGMDLKSFIAMSGMSEDDFNKMAEEYAETLATQELVLSAVIKAEKMELTDKEFQEEVEEQASKSGISVDEFLENQASEEYLRESILYYKAFEFIGEQAVEI